MDNILVLAAKQYKKHLSEAYDIVYGRSGNLISIPIIFTPEDARHLFGFQYCDTKHLYKCSNSKLISAIINNKIELSDIEKSENYHTDIETRLQVLCRLDEFLQNDFNLYKFNPKVYSFNTKIEADYFIYTKNPTPRLIFLRKTRIEKNNKADIRTYKIFHNDSWQLDEVVAYTPCSVFEMKKYNFLENQKELAILRKKRYYVLNSYK